MSYLTMDKCLICKKLFLSHPKKVKCCLCLGRYHLNCISLSSDIINYIQDNEQTWYSLCYLSEKVFIPFELNDKDHSSLLCDPDPDLHYFNSFNQVQPNSNYYTETSFKEHVTKCTDAKCVLSMCHLNIRSISKKLSSFENYLETIQYILPLLV